MSLSFFLVACDNDEQALSLDDDKPVKMEQQAATPKTKDKVSFDDSSSTPLIFNDSSGKAASEEKIARRDAVRAERRAERKAEYEEKVRQLNEMSETDRMAYEERRELFKTALKMWEKEAKSARIEAGQTGDRTYWNELKKSKPVFEDF